VRGRRLKPLHPPPSTQEESSKRDRFGGTATFEDCRPSDQMQILDYKDTEVSGASGTDEEIRYCSALAARCDSPAEGHRREALSASFPQETLPMRPLWFRVGKESSLADNDDAEQRSHHFLERRQARNRNPLPRQRHHRKGD